MALCFYPVQGLWYPALQYESAQDALLTHQSELTEDELMYQLLTVRLQSSTRSACWVLSDPPQLGYETPQPWKTMRLLEYMDDNEKQTNPAYRKAYERALSIMREKTRPNNPTETTEKPAKVSEKQQTPEEAEASDIVMEVESEDEVEADSEDEVEADSEEEVEADSEEEAEDEVPNLSTSLHNTSWPGVWKILRKNNFTTKFVHNRKCYFLPNGTKMTLQDLQAYCQEHYQWTEPEATDYTTPPRRTVPQDPGKPIDPEDDFLGTLRILYQQNHFQSVVDCLVEHGWKIKPAWSPLDDWYYIRPGIENPRANGTLHVDYFTADSLWEHVKSLCPPMDTELSPPPRGKQGRRLEYTSDDDEEDNLSKQDMVLKRLVQRGNWDPVWKQLRQMKWRRQGEMIVRPHVTSIDTAEKNVDFFRSEHHVMNFLNDFFDTSQEEKKPRYVHNFWKHEDLPTFAQVEPSLVKLGFTAAAQGRYTWPDTRHNMTVPGLRKALCARGIPNFTPTPADVQNYRKAPHKYTCPSLTYAATLALTRWVRFANVPVPTQNSQQALSKVHSPRKGDQRIRLLQRLRPLGFQTAGGTIFVPGSDLCRDQRIPNVHFFLLDNFDTDFRLWWRSHYQLVGMFGAALPHPTKVELETFLDLAVWAANSSLPLPIYTEANEEILQDLANFPPEEPLRLDSEKPKKRKAVITPSQSSKKASKKLSYTGPPTWTTVAPILKQLGFTAQGTSLRHADELMTHSYVARTLVVGGIPDSVDLSESEMQVLSAWAGFASFGWTDPKATLPDVAAFTNDKSLTMALFEHGWTSVDEKLFPPGADHMAGGRTNRLEGVHFVANLAAARRYIREHSDTGLRKGAQLERLQVWAATCPDPLRVVNDQSTPSPKTGRGGRMLPREDAWYITEGIPGFVDTVLPILKTLGFAFSGGYYHKEFVGQKFDTSDALGRHCVLNGIPGMNSVSKEDRRELERWACFCYVDGVHSENCQDVLKLLEPLTSTSETRRLLRDFKWKATDDSYTPPTDTSVSLESLEEARFYVRQHPESLQACGRRYDPASLMRLQVWAATAPQPLPEFSEPIAVELFEQSDSSEMMDDEASESPLEITEEPGDGMPEPAMMTQQQDYSHRVSLGHGDDDSFQDIDDTMDKIHQEHPFSPGSISQSNSFDLLSQPLN